MARNEAAAFGPSAIWASLPTALRTLNPARMIRTPVMFVVWMGALMTTVMAVLEPTAFAWWVAVWLWATVLFGAIAEAVAEGRGKAQADALRQARTDAVARRLVEPGRLADPDREVEVVPGASLNVGDLVVVAAGEVIPGDGDVVEGVASVDESAITGESAPVIREAGVKIE